MNIQTARNDYARFIKTGGFEVEFTLTSPVSFIPPGETEEIFETIVSGIYAKHSTSITPEGVPVNSKNSRMTIIESDLLAVNYPVRNADDEVTLLNHKCNFKDSSGIEKKMIIKEKLPDETVGSITLWLKDYE